MLPTVCFAVFIGRILADGRAGAEWSIAALDCRRGRGALNRRGRRLSRPRRGCGLSVILSSTADPLGSDVVVASLAVRNEFGTRLQSVYAPVVIASFGTGAGRIDIRAIAPDGIRRRART